MELIQKNYLLLFWCTLLTEQSMFYLTAIPMHVTLSFFILKLFNYKRESVEQHHFSWTWMWIVGEKAESSWWAAAVTDPSLNLGSYSAYSSEVVKRKLLALAWMPPHYRSSFFYTIISHSINCLSLRSMCMWILKFSLLGKISERLLSVKMIFCPVEGNSLTLMGAGEALLGYLTVNLIQPCKSPFSSEEIHILGTGEESVMS